MYELVIILFVKAVATLQFVVYCLDVRGRMLKKNVCITGLGVPGKILFPVKSRKAEIRNRVSSGQYIVVCF